MDKLVGIPGTISPEAKQIKWHRVGTDRRTGGFVYTADTGDGLLYAVVSHDAAGKDGKLLWHISVSHYDAQRKPDRCPTWDELKHAAYRLVQADVCFVLIFPKRSTPAEHYVNIAETCLHLWETEEELDR